MRLIKVAFGLFLIAHLAGRPALCWDFCCGKDQTSAPTELAPISHCHQQAAPAPTLSCDCSLKADSPQILAVRSDDLNRRFSSSTLYLEAPATLTLAEAITQARVSPSSLPTASPPSPTRILNLRI